MTILHVVFIITLLVCGFTRCFIFNTHNVVYYTLHDVYLYIRDKKWNDFNYYGIDMFVGMFGHGKTLSMTHKARRLYKKYGDSIRFVSNYELIGIPFVPLLNFNQLVELGKEAINGESRYKGTVVLIDEIEDLLSHRNYAQFPLQMLNVLTQQRKAKIYIMCSAQRFFMVDKLFRVLTTHVVDCNKYWRFQHMVYYDAWDYENAMNSKMVQRLSHSWWFVKNADFDSYDTTQMIDENMSANFISNEESLARIGLDSVVNADAVAKPSRQLRKLRKKK